MCQHGRHTWRTRTYQATAIIVRVNLDAGIRRRRPVCTCCGEREAKYEYLYERAQGASSWLRGVFCTSECMKRFHPRLSL